MMPPALRRWGSLALFAAGLLAALLRSPSPANPAATPQAVGDQPLAVFITTHTLPEAAASARAPSLTRLADGSIGIAWLAGDDDDAAIWFSRLNASGWQAPQPAASRRSTGGGTFAHIGELGRPLLHASGPTLHLWFESRTPGGGRLIAHTASPDNGQTWRPPARLAAAPSPASGTTLCGSALMLADGGFALPLAAHTAGEWLRLAPDGRPIDKTRLDAPSSSAPPALAALAVQRWLAALPPRGSGPATLLASDDGGRSWQPLPGGPAMAPTPLALLHLGGERLLLAGNPAGERNTLRLWLSDDGGRSWPLARTVETAPDGGAAFSEPSLLRSGDGRLHLAYAWRGQTIKYRSFSEAWLRESPP